VQSVYRRPLPDQFVSFSSSEGRQLFREALAAGTLEGFFPVAEQFHTQSDPAFCGLSSLVVALNALGVDPGRLWKGPWRWFGEELLDCCAPLEAVRESGVTLMQLGCLARCNGASAETLYADAQPLDALRQDVIGAMQSAGGLVVVAAYSRRVLGQTGDGHFSPLAGYHADRDLVLVLDVARFKYPPHWVPLSLLHDAMQPHDAASGRARGWLKLRAATQPSSLIYYASCRAPGWMEFLTRLFTAAPSALADAEPRTAREALTVFGQACVAAGVTEIVELRDTASDEHARQANAVRAAVRATVVHGVLAEHLPSDRAEVATLFAFAAPHTFWQAIRPEVTRELTSLLKTDCEHPLLAAEIAALVTQLAELQQTLRCR
jgi:glutathione gamma-glutamylcysteinyltransferase